MKKLIAGLAVLAMVSVSQADLLVEYTFTGSVTTPATVHADLDADSISLSAGSITYGSAQTTTWNSVPYAQGSGGWDGDDFDDSKFWTFTITADPGYTFSITNISFLYRQTAALSSIEAAYAINGTQLESVPFVGSATTGSFTDAVTGYDNLTTATITLHGWGATSTGGDFRIDDVLVEGTVIPEPGTLVLLGLGAGLLAFVRRKIA